MKITLDIDRLLAEGRIAQEDYERLKGLASHGTARLAFNILVAFGVIAVAGGALALLESAAAAIPLGVCLAVPGAFLGIASAKNWRVLGYILLLTGSLTTAGGIVVLTEGSVLGLSIVSVVFIVASVLARSGLLAALACLSVLATIGGRTDYRHAMYVLIIGQPALTVVLFGVLSACAYGLSRLLPAAYARLALIFSGMSLIIVNMGLWVGSLWGDSLWEPRYSWRLRSGTMIPDWVFVLVWAAGLIAVGAWAAKTGKRWVVNVAATFGAIHFYTQYFERLGASPAAILVAGLVAVAVALGLAAYNKTGLSTATPNV